MNTSELAVQQCYWLVAPATSLLVLVLLLVPPFTPRVVKILEPRTMQHDNDKGDVPTETRLAPGTKRALN